MRKHHRISFSLPGLQRTAGLPKVLPRAGLPLRRPGPVRWGALPVHRVRPWTVAVESASGWGLQGDCRLLQGGPEAAAGFDGEGGKAADLLFNSVGGLGKILNLSKTAQLGKTTYLITIERKNTQMLLLPFVGHPRFTCHCILERCPQPRITLCNTTGLN